jgi:hypothetical protein
VTAVQLLEGTDKNNVDPSSAALEPEGGSHSAARFFESLSPSRRSSHSRCSAAPPVAGLGIPFAIKYLRSAQCPCAAIFLSVFFPERRSDSLSILNLHLSTVPPDARLPFSPRPPRSRPPCCIRLAHRRRPARSLRRRPHPRSRLSRPRGSPERPRSAPCDVNTPLQASPSTLVRTHRPRRQVLPRHGVG